MEREYDREDDIRDVLDNPEWDAPDIQAGRVLADFAPALAANIARAIGRPARATVGRRIYTRGSVKVHTVVETRQISEGVTLEVETITVNLPPTDRPIAAGAPDGQVREDMDVVGSDGVLVGTVASVDGGRLRVRAAAGGEHHYLTLAMVESVTDRVTLAVTAGEAEARSATP